MSFTQIEYGVTDGIATLTLNRPERLNAFTFTMRSELIDAFDLADADDSVRAVVVTGAGRAFCAGADLGGGGETFGRADDGPRESVDGAPATAGARSRCASPPHSSRSSARSTAPPSASASR
ncbi:enoyl-CoA hydratase-related protein [Nonomuraea recticatena]|uniref:enoyl-CoA hydratase-related protein n=1 Tax=Nonomuraea recticatena TaxID=46178 RepID=UPI0036180353